MPTVIIPSIHLNGSDPKSLLDSIHSAVSSIEQALTALSHAAPNGRDYYPQGEEVIKAAIAAHRRREEALGQIRSELASIYVGIENRMDPESGDCK